jgi:alanyl-tRNA synthetase
VAAVRADSGFDAGQLLAGPAKTVGGGAGRGNEVSVAGGRNPDRLEEALEQARQTLAGAPA